MPTDVTAALWFTIRVAWLILEPLFWSAVAFGLIALALKGRGAIEAARKAGRETRITLGLYLVDLIAVGAPLALAVSLLATSVNRYALGLTSQETWSAVGTPVTLAVTVFVGDFVSYWRHRLQHTRWLWPAHAVHHSDTEMTWLTGNRFHPVDRFVTAVIDNTALALLGLPPWALALNEIVRHYYGEFIHADLPWMYGPLGAVAVSPPMHRWHHARDVAGSGSNFATVFSVFDRTFGTRHVPGLCDAPLGVRENVGGNALRQLAHPFVSWAKALLPKTLRNRNPVEASSVMSGSRPTRAPDAIE